MVTLVDATPRATAMLVSTSPMQAARATTPSNDLVLMVPPPCDLWRNCTRSAEGVGCRLPAPARGAITVGHQALEEAAKVNPRFRGWSRGLALLSGLLVMLGAGAAQAAGAEPLGFAPRTFVASELAGGEPVVLADNVHKTLIYTAHEGTTHIYRPGIEYPFDFGGN